MGKASQKKRRNRYVQAVIGEKTQDLSGKQGIKRLMKLDEQAFRADVLAMQRDIARAGGASDDHLAPDWTPLFERYRRERTTSVLQEQDRLHAGTSQAIQLLPMMDQVSATATLHTGMQLVRTCLDRTDLFLFTPSAFAMSAYLLVRDARLSDALLPHAPVWFEYDRPRRMRADLPDVPTSAFWFSSPFQVENMLSAMQRGHLPPEMRRLTGSVSTARQREAWLLEVYNAERGAVAVLQYHVPSATWEFAMGHESVCPHRQCISETLERGGGFIVACEGCRSALATYSRVFATSLLITAGALRAGSGGEEDSQAPASTATLSPSQPGTKSATLAAPAPLRRARWQMRRLHRPGPLCRSSRTRAGARHSHARRSTATRSSSSTRACGPARASRPAAGASTGPRAGASST
jgi:hypothetical protein